VPRSEPFVLVPIVRARIVRAAQANYTAYWHPRQTCAGRTNRKGINVARITQVVVTCDLEDGDVGASDSISFTYGGKTYSLDLCKEHLEEVKSTLDAYAQAGHPAGRAARSRRGAGARGARSRRPSAGARESQAEIRQWAREQGYAVGDRGRIPAEVRAAYDAAQAKGGRRR
jgi:hypothetical protein